METKTLWKKNLDSKYISGEDLQLGNKGLKPETGLGNNEGEYPNSA